MIFWNLLEDRGTLLDGAVVADGEELGPKTIQLRSVFLHLDQPFGERKFSLEGIGASIRSDLIHVRTGLDPGTFNQNHGDNSPLNIAVEPDDTSPTDQAYEESACGFPSLQCCMHG